MKKFLIYSGLLLVVVMSYVFFSDVKPLNVETLKEIPSLEKKLIASRTKRMEEQRMTERTDAIPVTRAPTSSIPLATITKTDLKSIRDSLPPKVQVNKEFKENPHSPPATLMAFAKQLGPLMEKAYKNETDANLLTNELSACAKNADIANAARALCVQDVEKLSGYHPALKDEANSLRASVSTEVRKILETNDEILKK